MLWVLFINLETRHNQDDAWVGPKHYVLVFVYQLANKDTTNMTPEWAASIMSCCLSTNWQIKTQLPIHLSGPKALCICAWTWTPTSTPDLIWCLSGPQWTLLYVEGEKNWKIFKINFCTCFLWSLYWPNIFCNILKYENIESLALATNPKHKSKVEAFGKSVQLKLVYPPHAQTFRTLPRHRGCLFSIWNIVLTPIFGKWKRIVTWSERSDWTEFKAFVFNFSMELPSWW